MRRLISILALSGTVTFLLVWLMASLLREPEREPGGYIWSRAETVDDVRVRMPASGVRIPERKKCTWEFLQENRQRVLEMGSCNVSSDCLHVDHGYLSMLAINRQRKLELDAIIRKVDSICPHRASHDYFYSMFGLKIECRKPENQCVVRDITYDEARDSMLDKFLKRQ